MTAIRRVITGHDADGRSVFKKIEPVEPVRGRATALWGVWGWDGGSDLLPVDQPEDYSFESVFPPRGGVRINMVEHPPHEDREADPYDSSPTPGDRRIMELVQAGGRLHERTGRLHSTNSVDIAFIISGEIELLQDGGESVTLRQGDCIVVNGTNHKWINHGPEPCLMGEVMLGADRRGSGDAEPSASGQD
jgi:mannose-6-phosphate isomerase-like protein (cupin superfamily)